MLLGLTTAVYIINTYSEVTCKGEKAKAQKQAITGTEIQER